MCAISLCTRGALDAWSRRRSTAALGGNVTRSGVSRLAAAWSTAQRAFDRGDLPAHEWKTIFAVQRLAERRPAELWQLILDVMATRPGPEVRDILAAGPLEDLIQNFGEQMLPDIEARAKADADFAELLRGVWIDEPKNATEKRYVELGCVVVAA